MRNRAIVRREMAISAAINAVLSVLFFLAVFGLSSPISTAVLAPDFLPQALMVALMGSLVPALIVARGRGLHRWPIVRRALCLAFAGLVLAGGGAYAICRIVGDVAIATPVALAIKAVFGAALATIITQYAVRAAIHSEQGVST